MDSKPTQTGEHGSLPEPQLETRKKASGPTAEAAGESRTESAPLKAPPLGAAPKPTADLEKTMPKPAPSVPPGATAGADAGSTAGSKLTPPQAPALGAAPIPMSNGAAPGNAEDTMPVPIIPATEADDAPDIEPRSKSEEKAAAKDSALRENTLTEIIPPKPPVDIELFGEPETSDTAADDSPSASSDSSPSAQSEAGNTDFSKTVIMPPPNGGPQEQDPASRSTDAFIARVKEQLASADPLEDPDLEDPDKDPFASTIPH